MNDRGNVDGCGNTGSGSNDDDNDDDVDDDSASFLPRPRWRLSYSSKMISIKQFVRLS